AWIRQEAELLGQLLDLRPAQDVERHEPDSRKLRSRLGFGKGDAVDLGVGVVERNDDDVMLTEGTRQGGGEAGRKGCLLGEGGLRRRFRVGRSLGGLR